MCIEQADELRALAGLARDAGEILFEMAAMHDETEAAHDMLEKSGQLEVSSIACMPMDSMHYLERVLVCMMIIKDDLHCGREKGANLQLCCILSGQQSRRAWCGCLAGTIARHDWGFQGGR